MKATAYLFLVLFSVYSSLAFSQTVDSVGLGQDSLDTSYLLDSTLLSEYSLMSSYKSSVTDGANKAVVNDVQQFYPAAKKGYVFLILLLLLLLVTYIKLAFSKDMEELFQAFGNTNLSHQIFRSQAKDISLSSVLLNINFVVAMSLFVRFALIHFFHATSLQSFSSLLALIFLFTFFYVTKLIAIKLIGGVFELKDVCDEYIFNLFTIFKTVGLTLIPVVFVLYTAPEKFHNYVFGFTFFAFLFFALMWAWRGLSTTHKLLYRSLYHFFIYVCVVEISPIFLLFKLLTKTIQ